MLGGRERDAVAGLAGLDRQRGRQMGLAGAGRADQADVGVLVDPGELREVQDQRLLGARLGGEVEVLERLVRREGGVADAVAGAGGVAREDLGLEQRLEELLVGPALLAGPLGGRLQPLEDARRLELAPAGRAAARRPWRSCAELGVVGELGRRDTGRCQREHRRRRVAARAAAAAAGTSGRGRSCAR